MTPASSPDRPAVPPWFGWTILLTVGFGIWLADAGLGWRPNGIAEWGWRLLAVFAPTILALVLRPMAGGACVLVALVVCLAVGAYPPAPADADASRLASWPYEKVLAGYADYSVWLVLAAYFIARGMIKTGLARRIALTFIRLLGGNPLGLSYAVVATDVVLAGLIPSNAARVGGVLLPITRNLAELYHSHPGRTAGLLGAFLMLTLYQGDVVAAAMFLTGQAGNPLAANQARTLTDGRVDLHYANWFLYASVPGLASLLLVPWLVYRWNPPELRHTPEAIVMARRELALMGPLRGGAAVMLAVFVGVCVGWVVGGFLLGPATTTVVALAGAGVLLLTGVLTWDDAVNERGAWDVFIWYGGLVQLGKLLNDARVTHVFAASVAAALEWLPLAVLFVAMLLVYFYAHYGFASITAHLLAMFPAFVGVLLALGAPPGLAVVAFGCFGNFCAGLTHYGTTPAPIVFGAGYVSHAAWWRIGLRLSLVNVAVWLAVGLPWWKWCGLW